MMMVISTTDHIHRPNNTNNNNNNMTTTINNHNMNNLDSDDKENLKNQDPIELTFTSLIQQYLSLFQHANATFLAERMVAYNPQNPHAAYLLAMCHYRNRSPKVSRAILLPHISSGSKFFSSKSNNNNYNYYYYPSTTIVDNILYLMAKCCIELELYTEAEDCLLKTLRHLTQVQNSKKKHASKSSTTTSTTSGAPLSPEEIDNLIIMTSPCPIPNGAAGLSLLGLICQRTMRKDRAIKYYRMSLQLDPVLWTSYQSLCELGAAESHDPASIFGVIPSCLLSIPSSKGGYGSAETINSTTLHHPTPNHNNFDDSNHTSSYNTSLIGDTLLQDDYYQESKNDGNDEGIEQSYIHQRPRSPSFSIAESPIVDNYTSSLRGSSFTTGHHASMDKIPFQTPSMADTTRNEMSYDVSSIHHNQQQQHIQNNYKSSLPSSTLFATPDMTPIPNRLSKSHHTNTTTRLSNKFRSSLGTYTPTSPSCNVISRAQQVAARLYYEPSPESTPPPMTMSKSNNYNHGGAVKFHSSSSSSSMKSNQKSRRLSGLQRMPDDSNKRTMKALQEEGDEDQDVVVEENKADETREENGPSKSSRKTKDGRGIDSVVDDNGDQGVPYVLELLCIIGSAQRMLCSYRCKEALNIYQQLDVAHFNTGWVQHQVGRAYFEMADYANAKQALENMQRFEPHRMQGLELLSTALWHLKKEVELSSLAQKVMDFDRLAPESWCVVGNCFSLQKEHETAISFFRRSIQIDPSFTYSHTLSGHEYVSNEDFDHAVACFRNALRLDDRHYNAWYGLGAIYFRQEKFDLAEFHFQRALSINPQSSVLHCHLGMVQHANGKPYEALDTLACAFEVDPRNLQARFQRATIWMSKDKPLEALSELEKVRDAAPREASVHFAIGRVLKRLGRPEDAMRSFLTALDLDPKDNNLIKVAIDRLEEPDVDDDVSGF